jgi:hypothetical protein
LEKVNNIGKLKGIDIKKFAPKIIKWV